MPEGLRSHGGDCGFSSIRWGKPLGLSQEETDRGKAALWEGCWDHRLWHRFQAGGGRKGSQETAWGQRPSVVRGEWRGRDPEKGRTQMPESNRRQGGLPADPGGERQSSPLPGWRPRSLHGAVREPLNQHLPYFPGKESRLRDSALSVTTLPGGGAEVRIHVTCLEVRGFSASSPHLCPLVGPLVCCL